MRFLRSLLVITLLGACSFQASAQIQLHIANDHFRDQRYQKAIRYYSEAIKRKPTLEATEKLADSYRFSKNYGRAEFWYEKAITYPESSPRNMYYYGQMLKTNEKYDQARAVFERYAALPGIDRVRAGELIASIDSAKVWMNNTTSFQLTNRNDLNSTYGDFGLVQLSDVAYVYTTNRPLSRLNDSKVSKDQETPYYKIVISRLNETGNSVNLEPFEFNGRTRYHEATPSFTANYDTIYYTQTRVAKKDKEKVNRLGIFYSVRRDSVWSEPKAFAYNNENYSVGHPFISKDGSQLFFISDVAGGLGGYDIYMCTWQNGSWSAPVNLGANINSAENEFYPVIRNGVLYFSSLGRIGLGGLDLYSAEQYGNSFSPAENMKTPFNSPQDDFAISFDDSKETGFISSNRTGGLGLDDIYSFDYKAPLPTKYYLDVKPYYVEGDQRVRIEGTDISVLRSTDNVPAPTVSLDGKSYFKVEDGTDYNIKTRKNGYLNTAEVAAIRDFVITDTVVLSNLPKEIVVLLEYSTRVDELALNKSFELKNIYYDFNKATIRQDAAGELDRLVMIMKENPQLVVQLGSYCDSRGNDAYNLALSQRRAQSAVDYLVKRGIKRSRLTAKGYGETKLVNRCSNGVECSDEEHQENRRTDFQILGLDGDREQ